MQEKHALVCFGVHLRHLVSLEIGSGRTLGRILYHFMVVYSIKTCVLNKLGCRFPFAAAGDLFTQILSREMSPPLLPEGEEYSKEELLKLDKLED